MEAFLTFLTAILKDQTFFQVFVGGCTMLLISWMVTRGRTDKEALPPPAPNTIADVPPLPFAQGPREVIDVMREQRDLARRAADNSDNIRECVRIIRDEARKQTEILSRIAEDARVEARVAAERHHGGA